MNKEIDQYYSCTGPRVVLYRFQPYFADFIFQCYQTQEFISHYRLYQRNYTDIASLQKELLTIQSLPPEMLNSIEWVVVDQATQQPIGLAGLVNYHQQNRYAELLIGLLNSKHSKQKFFAPEATLLAIEYAFQTVHLNKLISYVYPYNAKAQKDTLRLGFTQEGLLKQHVLAPSGEFIDLFQNALLSDEFYGNAKLAKLSKRVLGRDITLVQKNSAPNVLNSRESTIKR